MANNFPYFNHQFLLSCRQHQEIFTAIDFMYIFQFLWITRFRCTLLQIEGSGATIRSHAHINICDESIPLFQVKKEIFYSQGDIKIYTSSTFNHSFYVISCDNLKRKSVILENILKKVRDVYHLSYNLFIDSTNDVYIILRKCEYSKKLKRKIGSVEASGLFLGNALGCRSLSIKRLESDIKHRCDRLTPENFSQALDQCLCSKNEGRFLEKLIIETIYVTK